MDDWVKAGGGSRRRFLLQTAKFSAFAFLGFPLALADLPVPATLPDPKSNHILVLGDWGALTEPRQQIAVANAMKRWASGNSIRPDALLMLGDNFYGSKSQSTWSVRDRVAEQATSSPRPECIYRTNDHARIPAGESRSAA